MGKELDLNALIGSRICHDLISPLGAIGNGVELLSMSGLGAAPEMSLIAQSVENANARIRFFRIAFGTASDVALIGSDEARRILADMFRGSRTQVDWRTSGDLPRAEVKLIFLLVQCLESALPRGGEIQISKTGDTSCLTARGERLKVERDLWHMIANPSATDAIKASDVQFALVQDAARRISRRVTTSICDKVITLSF